MENSPDQVFVLPGESAEKNRDSIALFGRKRSLHWPVEVSGLVETSDLAQARPLGSQSLLDFYVVFNLNEMGRHYLPPAYGMLTGCEVRKQKARSLLGRRSSIAGAPSNEHSRPFIRRLKRIRNSYRSPQEVRCLRRRESFSNTSRGAALSNKK
ncbi:MAG: hypothetical protein ACLP6G_05635 [Terriglobales bacterium]